MPLFQVCHITLPQPILSEGTILFLRIFNYVFLVSEDSIKVDPWKEYSIKVDPWKEYSIKVGRSNGEIIHVLEDPSSGGNQFLFRLEFLLLF